MITIIIPVYNEGKYIYNNVLKIKNITDNQTEEFNFCLIDDGSSDNSWIEIKRLSKNFDNIKGIQLSRNFGKESALSCGLENVDADAVIIMDSDLQHPPQYIPKMINFWKNGYEIVEGIKADRGRESFFYKCGAKLFNIMTGFTVNMKGAQASDFKLLDKSAVQAYRKFRESNIFFRGMSSWIGFSHKEFLFNVDERIGGDTKWKKKDLVKLFINSVVSYTSAPLTAIFWLGMIMFVIATIFSIETLVMYFIGKSEAGFPTVILLMLLIGSVIIISLSIIGLYIAKIYDEVKSRPRYIIKDEYN